MVFACLSVWCVEPQESIDDDALAPPLKKEAVPPQEWNLAHLFATPSKLYEEPWERYVLTLHELCTKVAHITERVAPEALQEVLEDLNAIEQKCCTARHYFALYYVQNSEEEAFPGKAYEIVRNFKTMHDLSDELRSHIASLDPDYLQKALKISAVKKCRAWFEGFKEPVGFKHSTLPSEVLAALDAMNTMQIVCDDAYISLRAAQYRVSVGCAEAMTKQIVDNTISAFRDSAKVFAGAFNSSIKDDRGSSQNSWLVRNTTRYHLLHGIESDWVEALHEESVKCYSCTSHVVFMLKAHILGKPNITMYDVVVKPPVAMLSDELSYITWQDALEKIQLAYNELDVSLGNLVPLMVEEGRLNLALLTRERTSCCYMTPAGPYVSVPYFGEFDDFVNLAHEIGHAIHSFLIEGLPAVTSLPVESLVELPALFSERLCLDYLMRQSRSQEKKGILVRYVMKEVAVVQVSVNQDGFERHMRARGDSEELTEDVLRQAFFKASKEYFGDAVDLAEDYGFLWPTNTQLFVNPLRTYVYAFSSLVASMLYKQKDQPSFVDKYKMFLQSGGAVNFADLRKMFGFTEDPKKFFKEAFEMLCRDIEEVRRIVCEDLTVTQND